MLARKNIQQPLIWVKPELDTTIKQSRALLETLSEDLNNPILFLKEIKLPEIPIK